MHNHDKLYIDGAWVAPSGPGHIDVTSPSTEEVIGRIPEGSSADVDHAVAAARRAFPAVAATSPAERRGWLERLAKLMRARAADFAALIASEVGMPLAMAQKIQAELPVAVAASYVALLEHYPFEQKIQTSVVRRVPVGVVGAITPWNYPLHQIVAKVAPALAAGCTVVLKPSEVAPLNAFLLAELVHEAGVPAGAFNLVSGYGVPVGEAIASHPEVDMMSFTGSTRAGRRVAELAARSVKRVALELGGKSPNVVLDDADLELAVKRGVGNCMLNSGQTCSAWTRMLVPRARHDEAVKIAKAVAEQFTLGDPLGQKAKLGPLVSGAQRERVRSYIRRGVEQGATLVTGGADAPAELPRGFYVKPTVFAHVRNDMTIAQEEIFGPVLCIIPYEDEEDAVRIANDTSYGLAAAVWSKSPERAESVARRIRAGQVDVNGGRFNPLAPFGGFKQSGYGREFGHHGLEEYLETQSLQF
ncbi:MAG: aldehyde dehydrogenase family protein [Myxococcales bacterium]|nr:aldehyde dehydrogenase family protein [Myxococcales bacterium]